MVRTTYIRLEVGRINFFFFFTYRASVDEALAYGSEDKDEKKSSTLKKFADW